MKQIVVSRIGVFVGIALILTTGSATAGMIQLKDADGATWDVTWASPQVGLAFEAGRGAGIGTLIKTVTFRDLTAIDIKFTQTNMLNADQFGLRFSMDEFVSNQSGKDWKGFKEELIDKDPNTPPVGGVHPGFAHFHKDGPAVALKNTIDGDKFKLIDAFQGNGIGQGVKSIEFGNGLVKDGVNGEIWKPKFIGIHEITIGGKTREFTLRETPIPVPEPASFALVGTGILALAFYLRRRQFAR